MEPIDLIQNADGTYGKPGAEKAPSESQSDVRARSGLRFTVFLLSCAWFYALIAMGGDRMLDASTQSVSTVMLAVTTAAIILVARALFLLSPAFLKGQKREYPFKLEGIITVGVFVAFLYVAQWVWAGLSSG